MSTMLPEKRATEEDIERALQARAALGTAAAASRATGIPERTLARWVSETHRDRYLAIRAETADTIHQTIAAETEDLVLEMAATRRKALQRLDANIDDLPPKDAAGAVKNLALAEAAGTDKALTLRGKATTITEHRHPDELYRELQRQGFTIESTATELPTEADSPESLASG